MISFLKSFIPLCCFILFMQNARATHVVGGDLTYRHIEKDSFEVTLVLYVDCYYGNPLAIVSDTDAMIGVFDTSGTLLKTLLEFRNPHERINSVNYNCVLPPSNACVDRYVYKYYTSLPQIPGGHILAFQRCCRNNSITNIVNPGITGATYWTYLADTVQTSGYNSAAVFTSVPPNFLCTSRDFIYNHSATDIDGDSLSYHLYTPYFGADQINNLPRPPGPPPYYDVAWQTPFSKNNMMNGSPILMIDAAKGIITVKPTTIGQFVVGIAVEEYRKGKLISTTRRDFQFNVLLCQFEILSAFAKNVQACNDTVNFINNSNGATGYLWDFGDSKNINDTSTLKEPTYIYSSVGKYKVKLTASKGNCSDSTIATVTIIKDTVKFAGSDTAICIGESLLLGINDTNEYNYFWKPALFLNDTTIARPLTTPPYNMRYIAVRKNNLCTNTDTINISVINPKPQFTATAILHCDGAILLLDSVQAFPSVTWYLNKEPVKYEELINKILDTGKSYQIKMLVNDHGCIASIEKPVKILKGDSIDFIPDVFTPDGDNLNDCFQIKNIQLEKSCVTLLIYNRWGDIMYNSDYDGICWDGNFKNNPASEGVYFFILRHGKKDYHGTLTLIR